MLFERLADVVIRRGWIVVLFWVAATAALFQFAPSWESVSRDDDVHFFPAAYPSVIGQDLLDRGFPHDASSSQAVVVAERRGGPLTGADRDYVAGLVAALNRLREDHPKLGIRRVDWYKTPVIGPRLLSPASDSGQAVLTAVSIKGTYLAKLTRTAIEGLEKTVEGLPQPPAGLSLALTGSAAVGRDMNKASDESVSNTTWATIALVVIILLVVYRSPLLALIPILTIALSVWVSLMAIALLAKLPGLNFQVINITNLFVIVVLFGAGTDYCLFLIARYREELVRGMGRDEALREAISKVGGALVASAGTVIVGLGMLWFSSFAKIQYTGPAIALSLAIGLLAALTLAPVLLHWLRGAVFWPFHQPHHERGADFEVESLEQLPMSGFWAGVADLVVRRPGVIMALCVLALTPLAVIGARTKANYSQLADLNPDYVSIVGAHMIQRHFPVGELGTTSVLIDHPRLDFRSDAGRAALDQLSQKLAAIPNVAEVRSASQPLGEREVPDTSLSMFERLRRQALRPALHLVSDSRYISVYALKGEDRNHITRIDMVFKTDPFSDPSLQALDATRRVIKEASGPGGPNEGASASGVTGSTALVNDLKTVTQQDERKMYFLVTLGVYIILVLLLRRPGICLYLMVTVLVGYLASLGMTELVFKALHTGPTPWVGLDWKVGFFLFVILVAVGEDYNIFLMSRVIEEERKHGTVEATRRAVTHTGGIISSCGLIMAGTFGSMLTGSLTALRELGFALGLGILLDTFLVRPVLVPAFLVLLDRFRQRRPLTEQVTAASVEATTTSG